MLEKLTDFILATYQLTYPEKEVPKIYLQLDNISGQVWVQINNENRTSFDLLNRRWF